MACYQMRQTKKGPVWDVFYYSKENGKNILKRLSGYPSKEAAQEDYEKHRDSTDMLSLSSPSEKAATVGEAAETYFELNGGLLSPGTVYQYQRYMRVFILPYFSSKQIKDVTRGDIIRWQETLWNTKRRNGELLAQKTCESVRDFFIAFMAWAVEIYSMAENPFDDVNVPRRREPKREMQVWTVEEFNLFIAQVKSMKYKLFFSLLFFTGCRKGEISALTVDDFIKDDEGRYSIKITKSVSWITGKGNVITPPKTDSGVRTICLPIGMTPVLEKYFEGKSGYLWMVRPRAYGKVFDTAVAKAGVKHIRIHDLRHTHASILISAGIPVPTVSRRLGHASVEMTLDTYSHCFPSDDDVILKLLDKHKK